MSLGGWLLWVAGGIALFALLCGGASFLLERARSRALSGAAREMGFDFREKGTAAGFAGLSLFKQGDGRTFRNFLMGRCGEVPVTIFDYAYTIDTGENSQRRRQTVAAFRLEGKDLPEFLLKPENLLHKIGSVFGCKDIDFEEAPEFSRRYLLRGSDERAVRALFKPWVLSFFEQRPGWSVEGKGPWLVVWRQDKRVRPERLQEFWNEVREISLRF